MKYRIPRMIVRTFGKCISFVFALFCVIAGLSQSASGESVSGTVRDRSSLAPLAGIRVILTDAICPLYGCNPCSPGVGLDTTFTDSVGRFTISGSGQTSRRFLLLRDVDGDGNGFYSARATLADSALDHENQLYMLPADTPTPLEGTVSKKSDSTSLAGIKVELHSIYYTGCMPSVAHDTLLVEGHTDSDGRFSLELENSPMKNHYIRVVDTDGAENGGVFMPDSSKLFNAYYYPVQHEFYMDIDPASPVSMTEMKKGESPIIPVVSRGSVSMQIPGSWDSKETAVLVTNARGATIDRLKVQSGHLVWKNAGIGRGLYCLRLAQPGRNLTVPFVLR